MSLGPSPADAPCPPGAADPLVIPTTRSSVSCQPLLPDAGNGVNVEGIPFRFQNALVCGLAYMLAVKLPNAIDRVQMLKAQYDEAWQLAADEDREKAPLRFVPRMLVYR